MGMFRRRAGSTADRTPTYFISHAYDDREARDALIRSLPPSMHPFIFPRIRVLPNKLVSNPLIHALMDCDGLIYLEGGQSARSFWVAFERDYALRMHKQVYAFDPATGALRRDISAPLDLKVFLSYINRDGRQVQRIYAFMKHERYFDPWLDIENLRAGSQYALETEEGMRSRLEAGGYVVVFWSKHCLYSHHVQSEIEQALDGGRYRYQVLPVRLDRTPLPFALRWVRPVQLYGDWRRSARHRMDDLIVGLHWLIYRNTHHDDVQ